VQTRFVLSVVLFILTLAFFIRNGAAQTAPLADNADGAAGVVLPAAPEPQHPRQKVIDKQFIALMGALGGAESMRITTRTMVLEHEMAAGAPWVTSTPSHSHLVFKYAPIFGAELAVVYELKRQHDWLPGDRVIRRLWWAYPAAMTILHVKNAVGNMRTTAPASACPIPQCEMQ
jgi:hypothetical protein